MSSSAVVNTLKPGDLVRFKDDKQGDILMYFGKSKDKKWWYRKYYFLLKGKVVAYPQDYLVKFEAIHE